MLVDGGIPFELVKILSWIFKIEPWSLWTNIKSAQWVRCPAVVDAIVKVVWVSIGVVLMTVQSQVVSIQIILGLHSLWERSSCLHFKVGLHEVVWNSDSEEAEHWKGGILSSQHLGFESSADFVQEPF